MLRKVIITGPESTGKSTLVKALAAHFQTNWVPEYARAYLDKLKQPYNRHDLLNIVEGQLRLESSIEKKSKGLLFYDTSLIVLKVWYEHKYGKIPPLLSENLKHFTADLFLLPNIDLPWKFDPQREHPHRRKYFFDIYKKELKKLQANYIIISGTGEKRLKKAIEAVKQMNLA